MNSVNDRETTDYTATDYIEAILATLRHYDSPIRGRGTSGVDDAAGSLITHIVALEGGEVPVNVGEIEVGFA